MIRQDIRCSIYTRKSSEEGLEQAFNSLDAQREACEAFIISQKHEGWSALPALYDDGGISGGTMERPALQRLLADIASGKIDVVVVYKVDRLTRSLADFVKIVEAFDAKGVSFVSVTQQFNTTSSMGRLTLNVLLSFAQFEREVTGERIRDKIAASKKKGMWMGGQIPLGYDVKDRALVINKAEAVTIRHIFERYAALDSVRALKEALDRDGFVSKHRVDKHGRQSGGKPFSRGALYLLLQNHLYRGEIEHKGSVYPGQHHAIIGDDLWKIVQEQVADNRVARSTGVNSISPSLLAGLVFDETGDRMTPTHANKKGTRYRYYVSRGLIGGKTDLGKNTGRRIAAGDLERIVQTRVVEFLSDQTAIHGAIQTIEPDGNDRQRILDASATLAKQWSVQSAGGRRAMLVDLLSRIDVRSRSIDLIVRPGAIVRIATSGIDDRDETSRQDDNPTIDISTPIRIKRVGREMKLVIDAPNGTPAKADPVLLRLLAKAQRYRNFLLVGDGGSIQELADKEGVSRPYFSSIVRLGFLSPDIIEAVVRGELPNRLTAKWLLKNTALPLDWSTQREMLGFG
jgi:site-specific DNA recombinase